MKGSKKMNVKQNIGTLNALIRITIGLTVLACCTARLVRKPWRESNILFATLGAMKVAEGIVRFCPITALFQQGQEIWEDKNNQDKDITKFLPNNPF